MSKFRLSDLIAEEQAMIEQPSSQPDHDLEDVPVEGPEVPDVEDLPEGYVLPGEVRDYSRSGDATDEGGDLE